MNLEDKNVTTCQLNVVDQGLRKMSTYESGLGPKIKFVMLHSNFNFYFRSNSMQALQTIGQHRSKPYHEKDNFSYNHN